MDNGNNPLPDGWVWTTLSNAALVNPRDPGLTDLPANLLVTFVPMAAVDGDVGAIVDPRQRPLGEVRKGFTSFADGDVLFAKITPCMENGKAAIARALVNGRGFGSTEFHVLRPHSGIIPEWLFYFVRQEEFRREAKANFAGTAGQLRVPVSFVAEHPLPLPPLAEQQRIVAAIEEQLTRLDAGVAALKRAQAKLRRYKAAVLKAACEGRLVPQDPNEEPAGILLQRILAERRAKWEADELAKLRAKGKEPLGDAWKLKYEEPKGPDTSALPALPEAWVWTDMRALTVEGPQNGLYLPQSSYGRGMAILRIDDYQDNWSRPPYDLRLVQARTEEIARYSLQPGDLVINRVNSLSHLGKCLLVRERNVPSLFESNMMRLKLSKFVLADFVAHYLRSAGGRQRLTVNAKWAVNQASINQTDVANTPVPLPPLAEQQRIIAEVERRLSVVEEMETAIGANLARAERLRQSVLKRAFAGKLVPQDPNDEPASVLLERITRPSPQPSPRGRGGQKGREGATQGEMEI